MKLSTTLFISLYCIIGYTSFAQSPSFGTNLNISSSFVCYGGQMTVNATVTNADFYQFQKRNESTNTWENIAGASGNPTTSAGAVSHTFYGITESITTRVFISKNTEIVYSNDITISPQRPVLNFQPLDITECNGANAIFRTSAAGVGTITYQWQESVGGVFQNTTNTTDFAGMTTANLTVKTLANNENGRVFRCWVKDQNSCENYSSSATLFVNQLSTATSPTLTTTFCEGDTAQFFVALKVGTVNTYEWQLKRTTDANYSGLAESNHFGGVNTEKLSVKGILPTENSYRLNVNFVSLGQNTDGTRATGTCIKTATRAGYTIRPRPTPPVQIDDVYRCGVGKINTSALGTASFYWYADSTKSPLISNNINFTSGVISETRAYYYSLKDANNCESYKRTFNAVVRPLPIQSFEKTYSICPSNNSFSINFSSASNTPQQIYVLNDTPTLPSFSQISGAVFSNIFAVPLPSDLSNGNYKFKVFTKNEHCYSDTSIIDLTIKKSTKIDKSPLSKTICEGTSHTFTTEYQAELPVTFKWFKNNTLISDEETPSLTFGNLGLPDQGQYKVEVTGQCGAEVSEIAQLTILPKIKITKQPTETIVCQNGSTKFVIEATGSGTLTYEWTLNGTIVGPNSPELTLENVPISSHNAKIKCKITSDCEPITFSDEVLLLVDDLPVAPSVVSPLGFCKSNSLGSLVATALQKHTLHWFDNNHNTLTTNQIDVSTIFTKTFFVSQRDSNLCESPKTEFQVITNEPFTINTIADKVGLCSTGLFNRIGFLNTSVLPSNYDLAGISYKIFKNSMLTETNSSGEFEISGGGIYKVIATKNYCSDSSEITILSLHPELSTNPLTANYQICKNTDITLNATGSYTGGSFFWYSSEFSPLQMHSGSDYSILKQSIDQTYYVSYGITTNGIYCETPRSKTNIVIKPDLIIEAETTNASCVDINDGKVNLQVNNGVSPYSFAINSTINSTGVFENMHAGTFIISALDAAGCTGEKTIGIGINPGVNITQQPSNITRCKTNIANFTLAATNYDQILWEKKLPNAINFEPIVGENIANLRIENVGNALNPHLSTYRAKLTKANCSIYTNEVVLFVNSISGTSSSKTVCENASTIFNLTDFTIIGGNKTFQWQYRQGTSGNFTDIVGKTAETFSINNVLASNDGYYRCKVTFDNSGGNSCIINTSTSGTKLTIDIPQIPVLAGEKTICKGQTTTLSATNCAGTLTWSDGKTGLNINVSPIVTTTYTATCSFGTCNSASNNSIKITVEESPLNVPNIILSRTKYCVEEKINLTAENCTGIVVWSNGLQGNNVEINATTSFSISASCKTEFCQSPESQIINITVFPILSTGSIVSNSTINCSGFNPLTINSVINPSGGNIQWQKSENCSSENPSWTNIVGEIGSTYNPPALLTSTCFRRMVSDSCQTLYSNITSFEIRPDPVLEISADKNDICFGQKVTLNKTLTGGEGICGIQWQINKVSSAVSSTFWTNLTISDIFEFNNNNSGNDSTFHFRARVDCSNSSCNLATSNVVSVVFLPQLILNTAFADSTICSGSSIILSSSGCKANILWSTGETSAQISVSPSENTIYTIACKNTCDEVS
ncbi:hypothetical protein EGI26_06680, partial [Lacihabitans sp. CCS-44]|uniref:Ig-like domain-containing protein n=1 Tax=Lacihabitans sp. CCS-44 TaxID=2487331 RepID=UPI0020CF9783